MVSKASEDLPLPERPVRTIRLSRGRVRSMFLRLCSLAPRISMVSCGTCYLAYPEAVVRPPPLCRRAAASGDEHVYVTRQEVPRPVPVCGPAHGNREASGLRGPNRSRRIRGVEFQTGGCPGLAGSFRERAGTHRRRGGADLEGGRLGPAAGDAATRQKSDGGNCEGRVDSHRTKSTRQLAPDSRFSRAGADRGETAQQSSGARGREEPRAGP